MKEADIRVAITAQNYELYYQPKFESVEKKLIGAEALMRLKVNGKVLGPDDFMPIVNEMEQMETMQNFLIHEVVTKLNSEELVNYDFSISLNMNSSEFVHKEHMDEVLLFFKNELINPNKLEIEITERREFPDFDLAVSYLEKLKETGIKVSLDDFGRGFNSLAYLRMLPIDVLKIDRAFMNEVLTDKKVQMIVKAVIQLAHDYWRKVWKQSNKLSLWIKWVVTLIKDSILVLQFRTLYFKKRGCHSFNNKCLRIKK